MAKRVRGARGRLQGSFYQPSGIGATLFPVQVPAEHFGSDIPRLIQPGQQCATGARTGRPRPTPAVPSAVPNMEWPRRHLRGQARTSLTLRLPA